MPRRASKLFAMLLMAGAAQAKERVPADAFAVTPPIAAQAPVANGAIFQNDGYAALSSGNRASRVGDILTVMLVERTSASKSNSANTGRNGSVGLTPPMRA